MQKNNRILSIRKINKSFDGIRAIEDFSCDIEGSGILALIGPNGAGKTTLFNIITGFMRADSGSVSFNGRSIEHLQSFQVARLGVSRTFQDLRLLYQVTVMENVMLACPKQSGEHWYNVFFQPGKVAGEEQRNRIEAERLLEFVGLENFRFSLAGELSYGQQKLVSLTCCLAAKANLLLLDEPVAGVDPEMAEKIANLFKEVSSSGKKIFCIEHNIDFVRATARHVLVMDDGRLISEGAPEKVLNDPQIVEAYLE